MWKSSSLSQHILGHLTQVVFPTAPYTLFTWIPGHQSLSIFLFHWSFLFFFLCCFLLGSRGSLTLISITLRGYAGLASVLSCFSHVQLFVTPWTVALQDPQSLGFSRQEYWSGLPCPPPRDLPNPWMEPASFMSPARAGMFFTTSTTRLCFSSVQCSRSVMSDSLRPHGPQHTRPPCPSPTPGVYSNSCQLFGDAIQPSHPLPSPSLPTFNRSQHQGLFKWVSSLHQVAKVLEFQLQHQFFQWIFRTDFLQDGLVGSPCSPKDSQESSPTPQFKSINSSVLSFLYSPTLTSIHDYWKNHSLD